MGKAKAGASAAVEVSGWGPGADFFMENTVQQETPSRYRRVSLYHPVQVGALLFVRSTGLVSSSLFPTPYQVEHVSPPDGQGRRDVVLATLSHRQRAAETKGGLVHPKH